MICIKQSTLKELHLQIKGIPRHASTKAITVLQHTIVTIKDTMLYVLVELQNL